MPLVSGLENAPDYLLAVLETSGAAIPPRADGEPMGNRSPPLAARYADRHPDLADLCLIRMSELHPRHSVVTVDRQDFRGYRRNKREAIPLICPPRA